jgi:hypothetical protein
VRVSRIAIISCGPSLAERPFIDVDAYNAVVAVNTAVVDYPAHWWVFGDLLTVRLAEPSASLQGVFVESGAWERLRGHEPEIRGRLAEMGVTLWQDVTLPEFINEKWRIYTVTAALVLAWHLGGTRIDVFGHDMAGTSDHEGRDGWRFRTEKRWEQERAIWALLTARLARDGIEVTRRAA